MYSSIAAILGIGPGPSLYSHVRRTQMRYGNHVKSRIESRQHCPQQTRFCTALAILLDWTCRRGTSLLHLCFTPGSSNQYQNGRSSTHAYERSFLFVFPFRHRCGFWSSPLSARALSHPAPFPIDLFLSTHSHTLVQLCSQRPLSFYIFFPFLLLSAAAAVPTFLRLYSACVCVLRRFTPFRRILVVIVSFTVEEFGFLLQDKERGGFLASRPPVSPLQLFTTYWSPLPFLSSCPASPVRPPCQRQSPLRPFFLNEDPPSATYITIPPFSKPSLLLPSTSPFSACQQPTPLTFRTHSAKHRPQTKSAHASGTIEWSLNSVFSHLVERAIQSFVVDPSDSSDVGSPFF